MGEPPQEQEMNFLAIEKISVKKLWKALKFIYTTYITGGR